MITYVEFWYTFICAAGVASTLAILIKRGILFWLRTNPEHQYRITVNKFKSSTASYTVEARARMCDEPWGALITFPSQSEAIKFIQTVERKP